MAVGTFFALASLAVAASARPRPGFTLGPIGPCHGDNKAIAPSQNVRLQYGNGGQSMVNVSLSMQRPTVVLEDIASVAAVDCDESSVSVTFDSASAFASASKYWMDEAQNGLFLVTNHMGDCDAELERGFFVADAVSSLNASLTLVASTTRTAVNETADVAEITFSGIPQQSSQPYSNVSRRAISLDPSLTISNSIDLPSFTLYSYAPYVTVTADQASVSAAATLSGSLKYSILTNTLKEFYVDFDTSVSANLGLTVDVNAPYNTTAVYTAPALEYDVVSIPGIFTLGPALLFDVGVDIGVDAAVTVTTDLGVALEDGKVHVDFHNISDTYTSGWVPTYTANVNISEKAAASIDPYVDVTVELACKVLGGLLDLSVGLKAQPRFNNDFTLSANQNISPETGVTQPITNGTCSQGVEVVSEFVFSLVAIVTQFWSGTIYNVTVPVANECYSWL